MKPKNTHVQNEEHVLKEKLKVVILSRKIKEGEKRTQEVTKQLDDALKLHDEERKNRDRIEENLKKKHKEDMGNLEDVMVNRMRELEDSVNMGNKFLSSTPHDKADVNKAIVNAVKTATAEAMDSFMKEHNNITVQAVMQSLHTLNTDDPAFTPYPWKGQSESGLSSKITTTADKRMKDTVPGGPK